ncbi:hypothetical protein BD324DRAFT_427163 [Kockovaella imperatae]|uniref:WD40-repeat-containing domain protein n=1 Tax=Kockovaella imperatae TaxID=4999 RepID=A0A1Y1UGE4_9TREE|nr:hypothetical protein BD324DRAFT_427163 [Kockovaella imperatae]ORX37123.1 hypothetical protein BD324DRAFT_427163 [Kockovaella imperatae]
MILERKEHWRKLSEVDWPRVASALRAENGLWPEQEGPVHWRLDGSEGPLRMRNRLERVQASTEPVQGRMQRKLRDAIPSMDELSSAVSRVNLAPWEDPFALALGQAAPISEEAEAPLVDPHNNVSPPSPTESRLDDESIIDIEVDKDDKMRRIAKTLEAGDIVEEAHNIVRIVGVDACPGLLILGKKNLYLVDGLVQTAGGEVIDAKDAPRDVLTIPGTIIDMSGSEQESLKWPYSEIIETNKRAFLFRDVALELYFSDKRNFLVVLKDKRERSIIVSKLQYKTNQAGVISQSLIGSFVLDQVVRVIEKPEQPLDALTRKWQSRSISNFAYLSLLNQYANRTPNDVTQYPVFPWVLSDYTSSILDLSKPSSFRDLTLPMGALTPARREAAVERYTATEGVGEKPFHYGTHYSSSMIVCGFLIRLSPFTEIFLALQGGNFDLADRLFSSISRAWDSASADNRGDVRELIPEFFYSSAYLNNLNHHDFGRKQVSGDSVDDVVLPPWALNDPLLFTHKHREALESDYVSRHLPSWIDLTFGCKQRDPSSYNCYHPLSYRGAVDLEHMEDESELAASTAIIHNFGQTPLQIFKSPHPSRFSSGRSTLPYGQLFGVAEQWQLLFRSRLPVIETVLPIDDIYISSGSESKPSALQRHRLGVPGSPLLSVHYGFADQSLRVLYQEVVGSIGTRLVHVLEGVSVVHAVFASPSLLVTVSWDSVITVWRMSVKSYGSKKGDVSLQREAILRGHTSKVTTLAASQAWSFLVSCSETGSAMVWDMNRCKYTRTLQLPTKEPIKFCEINESDGQTAIATATHLFLFSLNGHPIASTPLESELATDFTFGEMENHEPEQFTGGISFLKREFLPFGVLFVIGVGRELALYRCVPGVRSYEDEEDVLPWQLVEQGRLARSDDHPGGNCCMVKFAGETLYAAFEPSADTSKYTLWQWSLPEGGARHVPEAVSHLCMAEHCGRHFGLLEPKRFCGGCGGSFCGTHAVHVESLEQRYCSDCRSQLAQSQNLLNRRRDSAIATSRRGSSAGLASGANSRRASISIPHGSASRRPSVSHVLAKAAIAAHAISNSSPHGSGPGSPALGSTIKSMSVSPVAERRSREASPRLNVPPY